LTLVSPTTASGSSKNIARM